MTWERRGKRTYYYRTRRVNGRRVREYVGTGEAAEVAAKLDAEAAAQRALARVERLRTRAELEELDATLEQIDRAVSTLVSAAMAVAGFHWHRGEWRKRTVTPDTPNPTPAPPESGQPPTFRELVERAQHGDAAALVAVRPMLDDPRNVDAFGGDVADRSRVITIVKMVGKDLLSEEAIQRKMEQLRGELTGSNAGPVERLVVDRVVTMWLHLHRLEGEYALVGDGDPVRALYYQRAITAAQARYFIAIRELTATRRNALPPMQVNIAHEQVNVMNAPT